MEGTVKSGSIGSFGCKGVDEDETGVVYGVDGWGAGHEIPE